MPFFVVRLIVLIGCWLAALNCLTVALISPTLASVPNKTITLQFPDQSLGTLYLFESNPLVIVLPDSSTLIKVPGLPNWQARGKVTLPAGGEIYLIASYYLIEHPEIFKTLGSGPYACISFGKMGIMQPLDKVIEPLSHVSGLRRLEMEYAEISDDKLRPLKALVHLEGLDLNMSGVRGTFLKDFSTFTNLKELDLSDDRLLPETFADISKFENLRTLNLVRTGITDDGVSQLGKLKYLKTLYLANAKITTRSLKVLASIKTLKTLELTDIKFKAADLLVLAPLKLNRLFMPRKYSAAEEKILRKAMPQTQFSYVHETLNTDHEKLFAPLK